VINNQGCRSGSLHFLAILDTMTKRASRQRNRFPSRPC
jgi:hypothetical protein